MSFKLHLNKFTKYSLKKRRFHHFSSGKCKLKQQDTTMHPPESLTSRTQIPPSAGEDADTRNSHSRLVGVGKSAATLKDSLVASYRPEHTLTLQCSNCVLSFLCPRSRNLCLLQTCTWMFIADVFITAKT